MEKITYRVEELGTVVGGGTPSTQTKEYWDGDIPWISPADLTGYTNVYISRGEKNITEEGLRKSSTKILPKGTVLLSSRAPIGYLAIAQNNICTNQGFKSIVCNENIVSNEYLYYFLKLNVEHLKAFASGATFPELSGNRLKRIKLNIAKDVEIQKRIADVLSNYDNLIENNNKRIALLEKAAQELYKEWFVRFRFPGHEKAKFVNGLPEGWEVKRIYDYGKVETGKTPSTEVAENYGEDIMFVKTPDMHGNMFIIQTGEYLSERGHKTQPKKLLPADSIMVSCIGTGGVVSINAEPAHTNQQINSIILNDTTYLEWLYFTCKSLKSTIELFGATGATMTNLSKGKFEKLKVIDPGSELIIKYHNKTENIFKKIKLLLNANKNLIKQRDLLLPRLMSGKLEV